MPGYVGTEIPVVIPARETPADLDLCSGEVDLAGCGGTSNLQLEAAKAQEVDQSTEEQNLSSSEANRVCGTDENAGGRRRRRYARIELEELRYVSVEEQRRWWREVYGGIESVVKEEYDQLQAAQNHQKQQKRKNTKDASTATGKIPVESTPIYLDMQDFSGHVWSNTLVGEDCITSTEDLYDEYNTIGDEDESSNDEYDSIRRPAFLVEGEPDFESGPPLDGLEYLRRVRWEAAQIPKVKVAKLNSSIVHTEQTPYMPDIPEIAKFPANLLPLKDWESVFLADFSASRQAFSQAVKNNEDLSKKADCTQQQKKIPTMTLMLGMDAVSRAATLRSHIRKLQTSDFLSRDDCLWLFSLCVAVDTPLTAEMCASLRSLLRKCSSLLAAKLEPDDEVAMLSILVTIAVVKFNHIRIQLMPRLSPVKSEPVPSPHGWQRCRAN